MLAKIIVHAADREQAISRLLAALDATALHGIETNLDYLRQILHSSRISRRAAYDKLPERLPLHGAKLSRFSAPASRPRCRIIPDASATGTSACRRPGRWIAWRSVSPIVWSAMPRARPGSRSRWRADAAFQLRQRRRGMRRATWTYVWTASRWRNGERSR